MLWTLETDRPADMARTKDPDLQLQMMSVSSCRDEDPERETSFCGRMWGEGGGRPTSGKSASGVMKAQMKENRAPSTTWRGTQRQVTHQAGLIMRGRRVEKVGKQKESKKWVAH